MQNLINVIIGTIVQIIIVGFIPFIWWFLTKRKKEKFSKWLGLYDIEKKNKKKILKKVFGTFVLMFLLSIYLLFLTKDVEVASSQFQGLGVKGLLSAIIYAFGQTGFTEELFFRGFLLKRVQSKFGFKIGNIVQSILFSLLHCAMFFTLTNFVTVILIGLFTYLVAYLMGSINEKDAKGSIVPSWLIHGLANIFASSLQLFSII